MSAKSHRIDIHHHIVPTEYVSILVDHGIFPIGVESFPQWEADIALEVMDRNGIATSITSISAPGVYFGDVVLARELARLCNEISARLVVQYPQRFGAFAVLPLPDIEAALLELEYALDILHLDGVVLLTNIANRYLGDPFFDTLFAELNRRKTVVFIHPTAPPNYDLLGLNLTPSLVEFTFDTTRAVTNLLYSGTLERSPGISFILSHAGGTVPYLAWRISMLQSLVPDKVPKGVITYLKRLYYDTALSAAPYVFRSLQELVDPAHILFGTDYPFAPEPVTPATIAGLQEYDGFNEQTRVAIEQDNTLTLFPRLKRT